MNQHDASLFPVVRLSPLGAKLIRSGSPWLRAVHIVDHPEQQSEIVILVDPKGSTLGTAFYSRHARLPVRIFSRSVCAFDSDLILSRMKAALQRRESFFNGFSSTKLGICDAYRMLHGEADQLPGLFIDRYADSAVIQTSTKAMDLRKQEIAHLLVSHFGVKQVVCRDDGSNRDLEELPRSKGVLWGSEQTLVSFHDAGTLMEADLLQDGKTGAFLDQQENHAWCLGHAFAKKGRALDVCTYHGGFALALARAGFSVSACDENPEAIARAKKNAKQNGLDIDFQVRNAFDWLRLLEMQKELFSVVVLDPPALAKRGQSHSPKLSFDAAYRAYKELNLRAMRLLEPGGILITCSCSGSLTPAVFSEILAEASQDAGKTIQILERRFASHDHPPLLGVPETDHLKCFILRVLPPL